MSSLFLSRRESIAAGLALISSPLLAQITTSPLSFAIDVPIDHDRPAAGTFPLACEWGAPPVPGKTTILLVADGQQFFLRPGGAERMQKQLFGSSFNVLGIVGRSRSEELSRLILTPTGADWKLAYRLLNWTQWARDVVKAIEHLGLEKAGLGLYGAPEARISFISC